MSKLPVTVLMSVYNAEDYLAEAVDSILRQTFKDFEFIIIDDGSSDKSSAILKAYAAKDKRIKMIAHNKNLGLVASLNEGLKAAGGSYIARQDADDSSTPDRIEKQMAFLDSHPETVLIGSSVSVMDARSHVLHRHAVLLHDPELRQELLVRSPFAHGSVIFKKQPALKAGLYNKATWPVEDYALWLRLSAYGQLANLDEYLYIYREHGRGISAENSKLQTKKMEAVREESWRQRSHLLPKQKINLVAYKNLDMGQLRIERIIDNNVFISKLAWKHNQKNLALKNMSLLAGDRNLYKKVAGKIKRKVKK